MDILFSIDVALNILASMITKYWYEYYQNLGTDNKFFKKSLTQCFLIFLRRWWAIRLSSDLRRDVPFECSIVQIIKVDRT